MLIQLRRLNEAAIIPHYQTAGAAGFDLHACLPGGALVIPPGQTMKIGTGLAVSIGTKSVALHLMARSSLGAKGIGLGNGVGLIDSDYQGELIVALHNRTEEDFVVRHLDRIAQGVFVPVIQVFFQEVGEFAETTDRGTGGFGSTGT